MDKIAILKQFSFYSDASLSQRRTFEDTAVVAELAEGQHFFYEGDQCHQIALVGEGGLRVYKNADTGRQITLYHVEHGETCILTASCILAGIAYPANAVAETDIASVIFPAPRFREWVASQDTVREFVFQTLAFRMAGVMSLVEEVAFNRMDQRLAVFLQERFANQGKPVRLLQLTHEEIAAELGSAREVISRLLKEFERRGAIELRRSRLRLKSESILTKIAG